MANNNENTIESNIDSHEDIKDYEDMPLSRYLLMGIFSSGLETPSELHKKVIPLLYQGKDVIVSPLITSSQKVSSYSIGILQRLDIGLLKCQALVLGATRELVIPTRKIISDLGKYFPTPVICHSICIGSNIRDVISSVSSGFHVLVGTPGITMEIFSRNAMDIDSIRIVIIDDLEQMISRDLLFVVKTILDVLSPDIQLGIFSSRMSDQATQFIQTLSKNPIAVSVTQKKIS